MDRSFDFDDSEDALFEADGARGLAGFDIDDVAPNAGEFDVDPVYRNLEVLPPTIAEIGGPTLGAARGGMSRCGRAGSRIGSACSADPPDTGPGGPSRGVEYVGVRTGPGITDNLEN